MNTEKHFVDTVEKIYALALSDDAWDEGLSAISDLLGAACVSFEVISKRQQRAPFLRIAGEFDEDMAQPYLEHYSKISPRVHSAENYRAGDISYDYQIISEKEIDQDEFYNDFAMPQGLRYFVAGHLLNDSSHMALFAAQRSPKQGHVGPSEIELTQRLMPHFQQALNLKIRLAEPKFSAGHELDHLNSLSEAVIAISAAGAVVFANDMAEKIFSYRDGIECQNSSLTFSHKPLGEIFGKALNSLRNSEGDSIDNSCRDFVIKRPSSKKPFLASVRSLAKENDFAFMAEDQAVALLFVRDPECFVDLDMGALQISFSLSPQECDLAEALDKGLNLLEVAQHRGVAISTVRSQLYSLMSKVGVNSQSALMRVLAQYRRPFL